MIRDNGKAFIKTINKGKNEGATRLNASAAIAVAGADARVYGCKKLQFKLLINILYNSHNF